MKTTNSKALDHSSYITEPQENATYVNGCVKKTDTPFKDDSPLISMKCAHWAHMPKKRFWAYRACPL